MFLGKTSNCVKFTSETAAFSLITWIRISQASAISSSLSLGLHCSNTLMPGYFCPSVDHYRVCSNHRTLLLPHPDRSPTPGFSCVNEPLMDNCYSGARAKPTAKASCITHAEPSWVQHNGGLYSLPVQLNGRDVSAQPRHEPLQEHPGSCGRRGPSQRSLGDQLELTTERSGHTGETAVMLKTIQRTQPCSPQCPPASAH